MPSNTDPADAATVLAPEVEASETPAVETPTTNAPMLTLLASNETYGVCDVDGVCS